MERILVNIDSKKEVKFFVDLVKKMSYKLRSLQVEEKEDFALLALMYERGNEEVVTNETTFNILNNKKKSKDHEKFITHCQAVTPKSKI